MTRNQSTARLALYVAVAMTTAASTGLQAIDFTDIKQVVAYALGIITTGLVTARSYIDQSPSQIKPDEP
jgi:hypothetical protein